MQSLKKNEKGFTLLGVLMVLMIFSILGISILGITMNSVKVSSGERDDQAVFYIAEAGVVEKVSEIEGVVVLAFEEVTERYNRLTTKEQEIFNFKSEFYNEVMRKVSVKPTKLSTFKSNFGERPEATVTVIPQGDGNPPMYKVVSEGEIGGKNRTVVQQVSIDFEESENAKLIPSGLGIYSSDEMEINNGTIEGDLILTSNNCNTIKITGNPTIIGKIKIPQGGCAKALRAETWWINNNKPNIERHNEIFDFPLPRFPDFPTSYPELSNQKVGQHNLVLNGTINITDYRVANHTMQLDRNYKINNINFNSNRELTLDVGNKDISIVVNRISGEGHLHVKGNGTLTIYLKDNIELSGGINEHGSDNLFIYVGPSLNAKSPKVVKNSTYKTSNASVYAVDADIDLRGSGGLVGNIITGGKNVTVTGHSSGSAHTGHVVYAPNANVLLTGSGSLIGSIISKTFKIEGGAKVISKKKDSGHDPFFPENDKSHSKMSVNLSPLIEK